VFPATLPLTTEVRYSLAMNEMRVVLARLVWNFDIELTTESENWATQLKIYVLWEKIPFYVKLRAVNNAQAPDSRP